MEALQERNLELCGQKGTSRKRGPDIATDEMCTFLIVNISSLQLIPVNIIAYRSQYGSVNPAAVVGPGLIATICSTAAAIIFCKLKKTLLKGNEKTIIVHRRNADRVSRYGGLYG